eukprot:2123158-Heterocapsa_arctica.AAC.1
MVFKPADFARLQSACDSEWSDVRCVSELHALQQEIDSVGAVPANIYYLAIQNYDPSNHYEPIPGEKVSQAVADKRASRNDDRKFIGGIERPMGIDEFFDDAGNKRPFIGCSVGDSGAIGSCGAKSKSARNLHGMLRSSAETLKHKWDSSVLQSGSGWTAKDMTLVVRAFIGTYAQKMTPDGGG